MSAIQRTWQTASGSPACTRVPLLSPCNRTVCTLSRRDERSSTRPPALCKASEPGRSRVDTPFGISNISSAGCTWPACEVTWTSQRSGNVVTTQH
ncbi:hypothetical protein FA15DRAFT_410485 [Coprinopsis marcescibilis]|uniref:Uncharacterized protein n=1 Tax=Coprinopsis marcescibilis TaxID=230819 RepID=A0A5C3K9G6_COPMA|nr:hypothetical protein FA15DRAFT_410485 [Coprinopsis marcescibilis]